MNQTTKNYNILTAVSISHFLNDTMQSLLVAIYPILKHGFELTFTQIGLITLTFQICGSIFQPLIGFYTDKHPKPYSLVFGMFSTLIGLILLAYAPNYYYILLAAALIGLGSSVFHPEASRIARISSGGKHGLAQSIFQIGGNAGSAVGPLLAAFIILPNGRESISLISIIALFAIVILFFVGKWYSNQNKLNKSKQVNTYVLMPRNSVFKIMFILVTLMLSKIFYIVSISSFLIFYLMHKYGIDAQDAQYHLFYFLLAVAGGTILGGPIGDKFGRKIVILISIFGTVPFALMLPYASLSGSVALSMIIGFMLASAFPAIVVFAQELVPHKIGTIAGIFYGTAFGIAGVGAVCLGYLTDIYGIDFVYRMCSFLPILCIFAIFLPNIKPHSK